METFSVYLLLAFLQLTVAQQLPTITHISQEQIKDIGGTVNLQCSVENAQDFPVVWVKVIEDLYQISIGSLLIIPDNRFSIRYDTPSARSATYTLQIEDIQEADAASYRCEIVTSADNRISAEVELQVRSQPVISHNSTSSIVRREGRIVQLECYASGYPRPRISWRRENNDILPTGGIIYRGNPLVISSIRKEDRGVYYCVAENGVGRGARRAITVKVEFSPIISVPRQRVGQALRYDADLECIVEAHPAPAIIWMKDGIQLYDNQHHMISHFTTVDEFTNTNIRLITIEKQQYGIYVCRATNSLGTSEATIELWETIDPICPPACGVVLNATTETPLSLNGTTETPLSSSTLPPATAPTPTVSDPLAQRLPKITYISQEQIKDIGGTVNLQCSVENAQDFPVVWVKATEDPHPISIGSSLIIHDNRFSMTIKYDYPSAGSETHSFQIKDIQEADASLYQCEIVTSADNKISAKVELKVRKQPVISPNSTRSIVTSEGQSVQLECYASGYPRPRISWRRENNDILPMGGIVYRGDTLEISSIRKEDRGTYYCLAENGVGRGVRHAIAVKVEFAPVISVPRLRVGQAVRYDADLECLVEAYPPPEITWLSGGVELLNNGRYIISNFATADEFTNTNIRVMTIEQRQYGQYNCRAVNKLGTSEARIELFETSTPICPPACNVAYNEAAETPFSSSTPPFLISSE